MTLPLYGCGESERKNEINHPEIESPAPPITDPILPEEPDGEPSPEEPNPDDPDELPPVPEPPAPKPEPEPKPEPPEENPIPSGDVLVRSNTDGLRVRTGKGSSFAALGSLDKGDSAAYVGTENGWYKITFMRRSAYVSAAYAQLVGYQKGSSKVEKVISEGKKLLGLPYVYGAQRYHWGDGVLNPKYDGKSYDCSSLVQYIYKIGAGVNLASTSREQSVQGKAVSKSSIRRGDLLFFTNSSRQHLSGINRIGHVALYLGDNYILHTASDHAVIEPISSQRWGYYITARRFL